MEDTTPFAAHPRDYSAFQSVRIKLKVAFACLSGIPLLVFIFLYLNVGGFPTTLASLLLAFVLLLVLAGYVTIRRMADYIEGLSATALRGEKGGLSRVQGTGQTRELAMIADAFSQTLSKLEQTAGELGVRAIQAATLNEIRDLVSRSIQLEEIAALILSRAMRAVDAGSGYLAVAREPETLVTVAVSPGSPVGLQEDLPAGAAESLAGRVFHRQSPLVVDDLEKAPELKPLNRPDLGTPRLLHLSILAKGTSIGLMVLGRSRQQPPFHDSDLQFLQTLLQQVAYSVENARLYDNLQVSHAQLRDALRRQEEAQVQLLASARMAAFGELSVNVAHELNNPLTGIVGYSDLLLSGDWEEARVRRTIRKIHAESLRAGEITRKLLDFGTARPGKRASTDLNALLKRTLSLVEGRRSEAGIRLELQLSETPCRALVDPVQLEQVCYSLLSHALHAAAAAPAPAGPQDRRLRLSSVALPDRIQVLIENNGPTPGAEELGKMFDPFGDPGSETGPSGAGLYVSHGIARAHGGDLRAESSPDRGSRFVLTLPAESAFLRPEEP